MLNVLACRMLECLDCIMYLWEEGWVMLAKFVFRNLLIAYFYALVLESSKRFHSRGIDESHRLDIRTLIELQFAPPLLTNLQALPPLARRL